MFDKALPKDVAVSCINREVGRTPVDKGFAEVTGRTYKLFDYEGHPEAERVIVMMGSGCGAAAGTGHIGVPSGATGTT